MRGQCDCCGKDDRELTKCWPMGIETMACAQCRGEEGDPYGERQEANAHLISAAPELLAALKKIVAIADRKTVEFDEARAAIAKAENVS